MQKQTKIYNQKQRKAIDDDLMKVNEVCQKVSDSFYTIYFECHRASIRHLGCMNALADVRICGPVSMRYRSSETNYQ